MPALGLRDYAFWFQVPSLLSLFATSLNSLTPMMIWLWVHWREYSVEDAIQLIEPLVFKCTGIRFVFDTGLNEGMLWKRIIRSVIYSLPGCGHTQVLSFKIFQTVTM